MAKNNNTYRPIVYSANFCVCRQSLYVQKISYRGPVIKYKTSSLHATQTKKTALTYEWEVRWRLQWVHSSWSGQRRIFSALWSLRRRTAAAAAAVAVWSLSTRPCESPSQPWRTGCLPLLLLLFGLDDRRPSDVSPAASLVQTAQRDRRCRERREGRRHERRIVARRQASMSWLAVATIHGQYSHTHQHHRHLHVTSPHDGCMVHSFPTHERRRMHTNLRSRVHCHCLPQSRVVQFRWHWSNCWSVNLYIHLRLSTGLREP